jgi:hypothetical protein
VFDATREYLRAAGLPPGDAADLPSSPGAFSDGGLYKWEVAGPVGPEQASQLIAECARHGVFLNQITHTVGVMRMLDREIADLVTVTNEVERQLVLAVGPRSAYDISAQRLAPGAAAKASAYRLRGVEQVLRALADVERAVQLGVRGFLIFDEGLLWVLARMRTEGRIPADVRLKASSGMGVANAFHCRVVAELGADTINLQRDLDLGMIAAARQTVEVPFDLHTDNPPSTGGFMRLYEISEMVRVGAPVYLKAGNSLLELDDDALGERQVAAIARELAVQAETITRLAPSIRHSESRDL